ncbi:MAG: undecaprenyl-diphosphate phosphatase [Roseiflexus sp.]
MHSSELAPVDHTHSRKTFAPALVAGVLLGVALLIAVPSADDWWKAAVLGIVEGLTEFLPISSTGHLLIASKLLHFEGSLGGTFEIFIQLGSVLAVMGYYASDLLHQARMAPRDPHTQRFWIAIGVAFLPAAMIGLALHGWIKTVLFSPAVIGIALITGGIVLIIVERLPRRAATVHDATRLSLRQALGIGIAQVLALTPGVSRSAASIVGGMIVGLDRRAATTFSFYLAIPTLGAATVVDLLTSLDQVTAGDAGRLFLGMVVSLIVAWLSIDWLLRYVANHSFVAFGIYRIIAGVIVLALVFMERL